MRSTSLVLGIFLVALGLNACGSDTPPPPPAPMFTAVAPCNAETDYTTTGTTITFDMMDAKYVPKCLKVAKGATVEFKPNGGSFADHPLKPSAKRGDRMNNPIMMTNTGATVSFTFPNAGYFAYFCGLHGFSDSGSGSMMDGVVWVQ